MSDKALFITVPHASLPGVGHDAVRWHALLTAGHGFPDDARLLTLPDVQCSHDDILAAIRGHLVIGAVAGDRRVLTISAHGASSIRGDWFYATDRAVREAEVAAELSALPGGVRLTCVYDCCRAFTEFDALEGEDRGRGAGELAAAGGADHAPILASPQFRSPDGAAGWITVKSCRVRENSYHDKSEGGYFGYHLGKEMQRDPTAGAATVVERAWWAMAEWVRKYQHPEIAGPAEMLAAPLFS